MSSTCCKGNDPEPFKGTTDPTSSGGCPNPNAQQSEPSEGSKLQTCWQDAKPVGEGEEVTLLMRIGRTLARFSGDGFLQIRKGKARLVRSLPLTSNSYWHKWSTEGGQPTRLDPMPAPFLAMVDGDGVTHKLAGPLDRDAILYWTSETEHWEVRKISDLPICVQSQLPTAEQLQVVGFDPIGVTGDPTAERKLKALMGHGVVYIEKTPTAALENQACPVDPEDSFTYVTKVLPFPVITPSEEETGKHYLVYSSEGLRWEPLGGSETP